MSSRLFLILLFLVPIKADQLFEAVEPHMGTLVSIKLYASDPAQAKAVFNAAFQRIAQLDDTLSDYKPESELNRVGRTAFHHPIKVSDDLFRVLAAAQKLSEQSGGAFDITVGPVTRMWREARRGHQMPDPDLLDAALSHCGYRKLHLDAAKHTVTLDEEGMQLDAGGIAKGYAADEALRVITNLGIRSALVAMSGDLAFSAAPPGKSGWIIEVHDRTLELTNAAVSTSGDSEQYLEANGKRYSHIVDPITGIAITNELTVSIVAPTGLEADPLATAVSVLGEVRGRRLVAKYPGVRVYFQTDGTRGNSTPKRTLTTHRRGSELPH